MQETYLSAYNNLANFQGRASFKTWITKIMLNHCYHARKKYSYKNETQLLYNVADAAVPVFQQHNNNEKELMNRELGKILEHALKNIPHDYKIVFTLRELNGFNVAETSDTLGISESNVKVRLNRAKALLRAGLKDMYSPAEIFEFNLVYCDEMVKRVFAANKY